MTFMVMPTLCIACYTKLEYEVVDGVFRHPERQMIFVGDFIDRGPQQREVLRIARSMCEAGTARAVMGNHEFNAIGWVTQNKDGAVPAETFTEECEPTRQISQPNRREL